MLLYGSKTDFEVGRERVEELAQHENLLLSKEGQLPSIHPRLSAAVHTCQTQKHSGGYLDLLSRCYLFENKMRYVYKCGTVLISSLIKDHTFTIIIRSL